MTNIRFRSAAAAGRVEVPQQELDRRLCLQQVQSSTADRRLRPERPPGPGVLRSSAACTGEALHEASDGWPPADSAERGPAGRRGGAPAFAPSLLRSFASDPAERPEPRVRLLLSAPL